MVGVRAIVVDPDGGERVLLVRHSYGDGEVWYLPGGGVKRRETIEHAVRREVREEAGIEVAGPVRLLGTYSNLREGKSDHISVFVVEAWRTIETSTDREIAARAFFPATADGLPATISPGSRRRLEEWAKGCVSSYEW
jgi:ADP-ribose pyrophosphatase YjhB (NUDIX family)